MQPRFCNYCGAALPEGAAFCPACQQPVSSQPVVHYYVKQKVPGRGFGISSMMLGIVGVFYSVLFLVVSNNTTENISNAPLTFTSLYTTVVYAVPSILAIIFGFASRNRGYRNGVSTSGLFLSCIGLFASLLSILLLLSRSF